MANGSPQRTPLLTREKLLAAKDLEPTTLDVPEWGGAIVFKRLSKADKAWVAENGEDEDGLLDSDRVAMLTVIRGIVRPQLSRDDVEELEGKSAYVLERIREHIDGGRRSKAEAELKVLSRSALLKAKDIRETDLDVPEWGGVLKIRVLSRADQVWVRETSRAEDGHIDEDKLDSLVILKGVVSPALEAEDIEALMEKSADVVERVSEEILGFSASTKQGRTSPAAVEAAEARFLEGGS